MLERKYDGCSKKMGQPYLIYPWFEFGLNWVTSRRSLPGRTRQLLGVMRTLLGDSRNVRS